MKVNSNISQFNITGNTNVLFSHLANRVGINPIQAQDTFKKNAFVSSPNVAANYSNLYSSRQLLNAYSNYDYVNALAASNPNVKALLAEKGVEFKVYPENVKGISNTHLAATTAYALQIANQMGLSPMEKQILEQASTFHDFGKILIPKEILNKPAEFTAQEKEIMDLHSVLGYELLANTGMNKRVLELIKNHHMPLAQNSDVLGQILSVADIYSALREQRPYKKPLMPKDAMLILDQKAKNGEVSTEVVNALKASLTSGYAA